MPLRAQHESRSGAPSPAKGVRAQAVSQIVGKERKLLRLAEATPAGKFARRPAEGGRSVGEVYVHLARGNYLPMSLLGVKLPDRIDLQPFESCSSTRQRSSPR